MWNYEFSAEAEVTPHAVWTLWADPLGWHTWNEGAGKVEMDGPFAAGTRFTMTPPGQDPIRMTITEVVPDQAWVDVCELPELVITTHHLIEEIGLIGEAGDSRTKVVYRTEITGEAADEVGPELGPQICADFPEVVGKLLELAARA
ncbi:SRPBCC family protein [Catenulispora sp. NL8]|uniref:SRPBCC family protein n=1 Tax=Catenulispora pinistramenti TaxID=2705254 RepID=A0ABS5KJN2_9ACTN|nr:SRPBCC family protein [Catenulispora pinistramenti]MBS2545546.1 SRPBCC family protein [Catenulispora pinistramenti]